MSLDNRRRLPGSILSNIHFLILLALALGMAVYLGYHPLVKITSVPATGEKLQGIDVSNHQGIIDWEQIDQTQVNFVFMKATEGKTFTDKSFRLNWDGAADTGFLRGAYHFYSTDTDGKAQAEHFIRVVPLDDLSLPPVIDIELVGTDKEKTLAGLKAFVRTVESYYGKKPIFYINRDTYAAYYKDHFEEYPFWYADYNSPPPVEGWSFWQFTNKGSFLGIDGDVDTNLYNGSTAELLGLAGIQQ